MYSKKVLVGFVAAAITLGSAGALAQDRYDDPRYDDPRYDDRYEGRYDDGGAYDYAKVVDVEPLTTRVRVSTPQRECWDETRYDNGGQYGGHGSQVAGSTLLGAAIGAVIGHQIGDLLFAVANWSRHLRVDPEEALRLANAKFERRFRAMEALARERSLVLSQLDAPAWDALWNEVKKLEKAVESSVQ
jgi:hypothetical protein